MGSVSSNPKRRWMTPVIPETEPAICRLYSIPASLLGTWDGCLGLLCSPALWTRGDDALAASVADTNAAYAAIIEQAYERGCRVIGQVLEVATDTVPAWALLCDGRTYTDAAYPELGAVISAGLRIDDTHFRVPDRVNRFGMYGPPIGVQGGENAHTLTDGEMPSHGHSDLGHMHEYTAPFGEFLAVGPGETPVVLSGLPGLTSSASANITSSGGGGAHNNLPQYEGTIFVVVATNDA